MKWPLGSYCSRACKFENLYFCQLFCKVNCLTAWLYTSVFCFLTNLNYQGKHVWYLIFYKDIHFWTMLEIRWYFKPMGDSVMLCKSCYPEKQQITACRATPLSCGKVLWNCCSTSWGWHSHWKVVRIYAALKTLFPGQARPFFFLLSTALVQVHFKDPIPIKYIWCMSFNNLTLCFIFVVLLQLTPMHLRYLLKIRES